LVDYDVTPGRGNQEGRVFPEKRGVLKTANPELKVAMPDVVVGKIVRRKRCPARIREPLLHAERRIFLKELIIGVAR
jgi:hypothetical protein